MSTKGALYRLENLLEKVDDHRKMEVGPNCHRPHHEPAAGP